VWAISLRSTSPKRRRAGEIMLPRLQHHAPVRGGEGARPCFPDA
jgi:hypothetical protein